MANITYNAENLTITIVGMEDVEKALGDLKNKTPAAAKVAINAAAREARKLMIKKAKARYAVLAAGQKHLKELVQRRKATNRSLNAELYIKSMRNDLGYFKHSPTDTFTGMRVLRDAPTYVKAKVLKSSPMKELTGTAKLGKGFLVEFDNGPGKASHIGMVQRVLGSNSKHKETKSGAKRWTNKDGRVEKLRTMGSPSVTAMHHTIWPEVEPMVIEYLQERLDLQVEKVLARAGKAKA